MNDTQRINRLEDRVDKNAEETRETRSRIFDKLDEIGLAQASMNTWMEKDSQDKQAVLDEHQRVLRGNGDPGIIKQVDRLEQTEKLRKWIIRGLILAVIGGAVSLVVAAIKGSMS